MHDSQNEATPHGAAMQDQDMPATRTGKSFGDDTLPQVAADPGEIELPDEPDTQGEKDAPSDSDLEDQEITPS